MRVLRRLVQLSAALVALTARAVSSASDSCHSHLGDELLARVDAHFTRCLPSQLHAKPLELFTDALAANEFDASQQKPLSVVAVSPSASVLNRFASAVATAVAGVSPKAHSVRVIDLHAAASSPLSNHAILQTLRSDMASALRACPRQRTLFLVKNMEAAHGDRLPLLDLFLDPMNGERATLHDTTSGQDLDCSRAMFLFLYRSTDGDDLGVKWRDYFVDKWQTSVSKSVGEHHLVKEAFTPQALAGRLTTAFQLAADEVLDPSTTFEWTETCGLDEFLRRLQLAQRESGSTSLLGSSTLHLPTTFGFVMVFIGVLVYAKWFAVRSKQRGVEVEFTMARRRKRKNKKAVEDADQVRLATLRSHSTPITRSTTSPRQSNGPGSQKNADLSAAKSPVGGRDRRQEDAATPPNTPTPRDTVNRAKTRASQRGETMQSPRQTRSNQKKRGRK